MNLKKHCPINAPLLANYILSLLGFGNFLPCTFFTPQFFLCVAEKIFSILNLNKYLKNYKRADFTCAFLVNIMVKI